MAMVHCTLTKHCLATIVEVGVGGGRLSHIIGLITINAPYLLQRM